MRRSIATAVTALAAGGAAAVALALPASAINSYNAQPAPERTEVGAFVALWDRDEDGTYDRFDWVCSGAMVDDDTFLTAAHCTDDWPTGTRFFVSLEQDVQSMLDDATVKDGLTAQEQADLFLDKGWIVEGDPHQDAAYPGNSADSHDIGVLDFADRDVTPQDVWDFTPATLPTAGQLDELGARALDAADWWAVGYGTRGGRAWKGRPDPPWWGCAHEGSGGLRRPQQDLGAPGDERVP